jgi:hypothetical protein
MLAAALAGCGTTSSATNFSGADQAVAEQVEAIQSAGEARDGEELCADVLSPALRRAMAAGGSTCAEQVEEALGDADDFDLEVTGVDVQGERATARVRAQIDGAERERTIELVRDGDRWVVDSLGS